MGTRDRNSGSVPFASMLWPPNRVQKGTRYVRWKIHEVDFVFCCLPPMEFQALCAQFVQSQTLYYFTRTAAMSTIGRLSCPYIPASVPDCRYKNELFDRFFVRRHPTI